MGLINFMKDAGAKLFGSDEPDKNTSAEDLQKTEQKASEALERLVQKMNIEVTDLDIEFKAGVATINGKTADQASAEKAALVVGNISNVSQVDNRIVVLNPEPEAVYYTVQAGDSLSIIARTQYGDALKYPVIFEANRPMLKDPDKIYPGQVLRIPSLN